MVDVRYKGEIIIKSYDNNLFIKIILQGLQ